MLQTVEVAEIRSLYCKMLAICAIMEEGTGKKLTIYAMRAQWLLDISIPFGAIDFVNSLIVWGRFLVFVDCRDCDSWRSNISMTDNIF
jgi:hypothetical protein